MTPTQFDSSNRRARIQTGVSPLNILVVDDSAVVRQILTAVLAEQGGMKVTAASDPLIAMDKMKRARPDVIVLDLEMPRMDGLTFLRKLMQEDPIPVVVCSCATGPGTQATLRALEEGAVAIITKPQIGVRDFLEESAITLIDAVQGAAQARLRSPWKRCAQREQGRSPDKARSLTAAAGMVVAIGASTGGTEALRVILEAMPPDSPPILIVQHMPELFTRAFADRLNRECRIEVKEAADGDRLLKGRALIAPGNRHMLLNRRGAHYVVEVSGGPLVSRHRPSVDVLFRSVARSSISNAVGVILTGMGDDGASGLLEMKRAGAATVAQDEATSVVFGMPREAILLGAADEVVPLARISPTVLKMSMMSAR